jgi:succinyl-diaminopimelate desuccinylase
MNPIEIASDLVRFKTVNPPGDEQAAALYVAELLEKHGFSIERHDFAPGRSSLIATLAGADADLAPLVFTGHLDTVPLGAASWSFDPYGEIRSDRLYGRGSSDMKAAVAAMMVAAATARARHSLKRGLSLVITAAEETGSAGARHLAGLGVLGGASGLLVGEPTSNRLAVAHKGALHLRYRTRGTTAHGSMPHLGVNAVTKAITAIAALEGNNLFAHPPHALLGKPTATVTSIHGGENVNSVPDACTFTLDVRTLPGMDHESTRASLQQVLGTDVELDACLADMPAVGTDPGDPFVRCVADVLVSYNIESGAEPIGVSYFTDASVLQPAYGGCPTVILGPGEARQAHQTDEYCLIPNIEIATEIYSQVVREWCGT